MVTDGGNLPMSVTLIKSLTTWIISQHVFLVIVDCGSNLTSPGLVTTQFFSLPSTKRVPMNIIDAGNPIVKTEDTTLVSLVEFFRQNSNISTELTETFLEGTNLLSIQQQLTQKLRDRVNNQELPLVEFTESLLDALMTMAYDYRLAWVNLDTLNYINLTYVDSMMQSLEARYYESAFWRRWCEQGIPSPLNIPLPAAPEMTDFTAETDSYMLSDPWGKPRPMW